MISFFFSFFFLLCVCVCVSVYISDLMYIHNTMCVFSSAHAVELRHLNTIQIFHNIYVLDGRSLLLLLLTFWHGGINPCHLYYTLFTLYRYTHTFIYLVGLHFIQIVLLNLKKKHVDGPNTFSLGYERRPKPREIF